MLAARRKTAASSGEGEEIKVKLADGSTYTITVPEGRTPSEAAAGMVARLKAVDPKKADELLERVGPTIKDDDLQRYGVDRPNKKDSGGVLGTIRHGAGAALGGVMELLDRPSQAVLQGIQEINEGINASGDEKDDGRGVLGGLWGGISGRGERINARQAMLMDKDAGGFLGDVADFGITSATDPLNFVNAGTGAAAKSGLRAVGRELGEDVAKEVAERGARKVLGEEARSAVRNRIASEAAETGAKGSLKGRILNVATGGSKTGGDIVADETMKQLYRRGQGGIRIGLGEASIGLSGKQLRRPLEATRILDKKLPREAMTRLFQAGEVAGDVWSPSAAGATRYIDVPASVAEKARKAGTTARTVKLGADEVADAGGGVIPTAARGADEVVETAADVPAGHVRLYRGEAAGDAPSGTWFSDDPDYARNFAAGGGKVVEVDVPVEVANEAADAARAGGNVGYELPTEFADRARESTAGRSDVFDIDAEVPGAPHSGPGAAAEAPGGVGSPPGAVPGAPGAPGAASALPADAMVLPGYARRAAREVGEGGVEALPEVARGAQEFASRGLLGGLGRSRVATKVVDTFKPRAAVARRYGQEVADAIYRAAVGSRVGVVQTGEETVSRLSRAVRNAQVTTSELETWARALDGGDAEVIRHTLTPEKATLYDELVRMRQEAAAELRDIGVEDQEILNHVGTRLARVLTNEGQEAVEGNVSAVGRALGHSATEVEQAVQNRRQLGPNQLGVLGEGNLADVQDEASEAMRVIGGVEPHQGGVVGAAKSVLPGMDPAGRLLEQNPVELIANTRNQVAQVAGRVRMADEIAEKVVDPATGEQLVHRFTPEQLAAAKEAKALKAKIAAQEEALARKLESGKPLTPEEAAELEAARAGELPAGGEPSTRVKSPADDVKLTAEEKANAKAREELEKARRKAAKEGGDVEERDLQAELDEQLELAGDAADFQVPEGWSEINLGAGDEVGKAYAPKEIADAVSNAQAMFVNDRSVKAYQSLLDRVNRAWKISATSPVLAGVGFHSRNFQGNLFNNYLAGVVNPAHYIKAGVLQRKISNAVRDVGPEGFEAALRKAGVSERDVKLVMEARKRGVLDNAFFTTDLARSDKAAIAPAGRGARAARKAGRVAMGQPFGKAIENNARLAHFLHKVDELGNFDDAAMSVKKYLFDYADLTNAERNIFGRSVAFYTFAKNNTALQMSQLLHTPGKYGRLPKAELLIMDDDQGQEGPDGGGLPDYAVRQGQVPLRPGLRKVLGGDNTPLMGSVDLPFGAAVDTVLPATQLASLAPGPVGGAARAVLPAALEADRSGEGTQEAFRNLINVSSGAIPEVVKHVFEQATGKSVLTGAPIKSNQSFARQAGTLIPLLSKLQAESDDVRGTGRSEGRSLGRERVSKMLLGLNLTPLDKKAMENLGYAGLDLVTQYAEDAARAQPGGVLPPLEWLREQGIVPELPSRRKGGPVAVGATSARGMSRSRQRGGASGILAGANS